MWAQTATHAYPLKSFMGAVLLFAYFEKTRL
jgi:hypothetical protein